MRDAPTAAPVVRSFRRRSVCTAWALGVACSAWSCERPVSVHVGPRVPRVEVLAETPGVGLAAGDGSLVTAHYTLTTPAGETILTTRRSGEPERWILGEGSVIEGMDDAVRGMRAGGRRRVEIPPELHWGRAGHGGKVPPNTSLIAEVEVVLVR